MSDKFTVEIISPDKLIIKTEAIEVILPSFEGEMGILRDHIPLITFLRPGLIKIKNGSEKKYFVDDGTVEFSNNNLLILTSTAEELSKINKDTISIAIENAKNKMNSDDSTDKEKYILSHKIDTLKNINQ
tara:strand:+ start:295 stop:684 length:390 start_codon:yes stop_codon:yes gene_type:complete